MKITTQSFLKTFIHYDPDTGAFTWILRFKRNFVDGKPLGFKNPKGYLLINFFGTIYRAHRLAFFYMTGEWPKSQVDHENNIKHDNRWLNLRRADNQLNHYNLNKPKNNTSGAKGVKKLKTGKYEARIKFNQKEIHIGTFDSLEKASDAYFNKAKEIAREFANIG
jgi:hypothetical protein